MSHFGNVNITAGKLAIKNENITGTFDLDMNSITNINLEGDESQL